MELGSNNRTQIIFFVMYQRNLCCWTTSTFLQLKSITAMQISQKLELLIPIQSSCEAAQICSRTSSGYKCAGYLYLTANMKTEALEHFVNATRSTKSGVQQQMPTLPESCENRLSY